MISCTNCGKKISVFSGCLEIGALHLCERCSANIGNAIYKLKNSKLDKRTFLNAVETIETDSILSEDAKQQLKNEARSLMDVGAEENGNSAPDTPWQNLDNWDKKSRFSMASGEMLPYVVLQVTLKEKFIGTGSGNLEDLEDAINAQVAKGYRLHTMSTSNGGSKGLAGGDRIQATLVFERLDIANGTYHPGSK